MLGLGGGWRLWARCRLAAALLDRPVPGIRAPLGPWLLSACTHAAFGLDRGLVRMRAWCRHGGDQNSDERAMAFALSKQCRIGDSCPSNLFAKLACVQRYAAGCDDVCSNSLAPLTPGR